ncbi:hypothetical protein [Nocardia grenadensis]|uniref:hypothetical protein n=1 Tax=Nocardia grenadensis TaxID=931537 RepID=UPI0007A4B46A|nr:hypothetical protein [Nocardia grenadensis]
MHDHPIRCVENPHRQHRHGAESPLGPAVPPEQAGYADGASARADMCRTEVDGLRATWRLLRDHAIAIVLVEKLSDATPVVCFPSGSYPDLARARELHPELAGLWDAIRHEFWGRLMSPLCSGPGARVWA